MYVVVVQQRALVGGYVMCRQQDVVDMWWLARLGIVLVTSSSQVGPK